MKTAISQMLSHPCRGRRVDLLICTIRWFHELDTRWLSNQWLASTDSSFGDWTKFLHLLHDIRWVSTTIAFDTHKAVGQTKKAIARESVMVSKNESSAKVPFMVAFMWLTKGFNVKIWFTHDFWNTQKKTEPSYNSHQENLMIKTVFNNYLTLTVLQLFHVPNYTRS